MGQEQSRQRFPFLQFPHPAAHHFSEEHQPPLNLTGKVVLVLGGTGIIGSGAVHQFIHRGAKVVVASRHESRLTQLLERYPDYVKTDSLIGVLGKYETKEQVEATYEEIKRHLSGQPIDHILSVLGPISLGLHSVSKAGISESDVKLLRDSLEENLFPTIVAAQVYLKDLKQREGSTYTVVSGGYGPGGNFFPGAWAGAIKNAALDAVITSLIVETKDDLVRVNGCGVHFGIAPANTEITNQYHLQDTNLFANVFLRFIQKKELKGQMIHFNLREDTEHF